MDNSSHNCIEVDTFCTESCIIVTAGCFAVADVVVEAAGVDDDDDDDEEGGNEAEV